MKLYYATSDYRDAEVIIFGIPYDRTSSFVPGSRFGPEYIRLCSENIEDYSPYQDRSLATITICDHGDMHFSTPDHITEMQNAVEGIMDARKRFIFLGGEHTVTVPIVRALKKTYRQFSLIQFDAHCDLRDEYLGEKICHATAMRRVADSIGLDNVYQFGIRSGTQEEFAVNKNIDRFKVHEPLSKIISKIKEPIYVTIDVDVINPGFLPAVATPEPGGISYNELVDSLLLLKNRNIISADIVEYNPLSASPFASGSTVAELLRELILVMARR